MGYGLLDMDAITVRVDVFKADGKFYTDYEETIHIPSLADEGRNIRIVRELTEKMRLTAYGSSDSRFVLVCSDERLPHPVMWQRPADAVAGG